MLRCEQVSFDNLSIDKLYAILQLRQQVFIIEQQSIYCDIDGNDRSSTHFCVFSHQELLGYARLRKLDNQQVFKIERVVTSAESRGLGVANLLINAILEFLQTQCSNIQVQLSSQTSVQGFYLKWGFIPVGEPYDDAGVEHVDMVLEQ